MRRVVVTGMGAISALGNDVASLWQGLLAGRSGIARISKFDPSRLPVQIAGEVKGFDPSPRIDPKSARRMDLYCQYALWCAIEAVQDAKIDFAAERADRCGAIVGSGMGGVHTWEAEFGKFVAKGPSRISPLLIPMMIPDMAAGQIAIQYKLRGPNFATVSACASGAHAIGESYRLIKYGAADVIVAGGSEAAVTEFTVGGFPICRRSPGAMMNPKKRPGRSTRTAAASSSPRARASSCSKNWNTRRSAARASTARLPAMARPATAIISPPRPPKASAPCEAMQMAIEDSGVGIDGVDYINAHGTSTDLNDLTETQAIKRLFGEHASKLVVNSSKSMIGHALGASGALEFVVTCLSVLHQKVHRTLNLDNPDTEMTLDYVREGARDVRIRSALSNSFGFGGHNCCLLAKKYNG